MDKSVDELMWLIAETSNHAAVEEFIKRHPEHRLEMLKRMNLVNDMRGARPTQSEGAAHFTPRADIRALANPRPRWELIGGGFAIFASAVFVAYTMAPNRTPKAELPQSSPAVTATTVPDPRQDPGYNPDQNVVPPTPIAPSRPPAYTLPVTIEGDSISLVVVLNEISRQTNLNIEMGPGMPNAVVSVNYIGRTAMDVLRDLGQKLGFTVFDQQANSVLLIPAVDTSRATREQGPLESDPVGEPNSRDIPRITETE